MLLFLDAIREMRKYSGHFDELTDSPLAQTSMHMKLFRAQRNFYIAGFALFLCLVLKRMIMLLSTQATLNASYEAAMRQAKSATEAAEKMMKENKESKNVENLSNEREEEQTKTITALQEELDKSQSELSKAKKDLLAMKQQSESVANEYDRLLAEHARLQETVGQGDFSSKKDE